MICFPQHSENSSTYQEISFVKKKQNSWGTGVTSQTKVGMEAGEAPYTAGPQRVFHSMLFSY